MPPNHMYLHGKTGKILWYGYFTTIKKSDVLNGGI